MKKNKFLLLTLSMLMLVSCGGGDNSSNGPETSSAPEGGETKDRALVVEALKTMKNTNYSVSADSYYLLTYTENSYAILDASYGNYYSGIVRNNQNKFYSFDYTSDMLILDEDEVIVSDEKIESISDLNPFSLIEDEDLDLSGSTYVPNEEYSYFTFDTSSRVGAIFGALFKLFYDPYNQISIDRILIVPVETEDSGTFLETVYYVSYNGQSLYSEFIFGNIGYTEDLEFLSDFISTGTRPQLPDTSALAAKFNELSKGNYTATYLDRGYFGELGLGGSASKYAENGIYSPIYHEGIYINNGTVQIVDITEEGVEERFGASITEKSFFSESTLLYTEYYSFRYADVIDTKYFNYDEENEVFYSTYPMSLYTITPFYAFTDILKNDIVATGEEEPVTLDKVEVKLTEDGIIISGLRKLRDEYRLVLSVEISDIGSTVINEFDGLNA